MIDHACFSRGLPLGTRRAYHAPMNEVQRLAYLEAMDIQTFVSRRNLPGAAPSRRFRIARLPASVAAAPTPPAAKERVPAAKERPPAALDLPELESKPKAAPAAMAPTRPQATDTPVFTVAASEAGGWLWVDEIPAGRDPGQDYGPLLGAICQALGLAEQAPQVQLFNYPVAAGAALAGGVDEARQALFGFLSGRISRIQPQRIILLGELDQPWFDVACLDGVQVTRTVSAWGMLRDPALKARAWRDLKPLKSDAA